MFNWQNGSDSNISKILSDTTDNLIKELSGGPIRHEPKVIDNLIAFVGVAGGVGTSTIVANLAYTLKKKGLTILVIDLNIAYPIQHNYFRVKQTVEKPDLVSFLLGKNSIGESIESKGDISVLVANNRTLMDEINCDTELCSKNFEAVIEKIRPLFDMIIMDCPNDIKSDVVNTALYRADHIYTVWDENIACISNMERMRRNMTLSGIEAYNKVKVVFNARTSIYYSKYPFEKLNLEVIANFPFELAIKESALKGEIFCEKGASMSRNAAFYVDEMNRLATRILEIGGFKNNK